MKRLKKLIVIGLDGAHFELINPWVRAGKLPNIKRIINQGVKGDLQSCLPPVTSPNWKCYSTGKNPAKLGIFWWENIDLTRKKVYFPFEKINKEKEIWDYLTRKGFKVCVIGTPLTYPPKKVNGVFISGGLDAEEERFTYPPNLEKKLKKRYNYRVRPKNSIVKNKREAVKEIHQLIDLRFRVAENLAQKQNFDFIQVTTFYLNVLQHFLWRSPATLKAWQIIDKHCQRLMNKKNVNIILMSDHGSNKIQTVFNINTWLNKQGYLKYSLSYQLTRLVYFLGINKEKIINLCKKLGVEAFLRKNIPGRIVNKIPSEKGIIQKGGKAYIINWEKSSALASGQGPIYLLDKQKKQEIINKLERLKDKNGKKIVKKVWRREEIYKGKYLNQAPDLIIDQARNVHISGGIGARDIFENQKKWLAENKKEGLFLAWGPAIKKGQVVKNAQILDLAPTILYLFGLPIPKDMDGKILKSILKQ